MFVRYFVVFAALLIVGACSSTKDSSSMDQDMNAGARDGVSALDGIYGENLEGPTPGSQADFIVNVGDRVFFGYDRYDLTPEAQDTLQRQAQWLAQYSGLSIYVEGHADERGTREYNLALGERRANSAKNYLEALGVDPSRITTISYGKERPAVPGSNETAWAQNRRAVTVVE